MKKGLLLLGVLLLALTVACATTVPIAGYTSSAPVKISPPGISSSKLEAKAELKILEARIEPSSPKSEEEVYIILMYEAPAGRELKASVNGEVLVSAEMAGPYSRKKTFIKECRGTGAAAEMRISLGKFHSTREDFPVRLDIYLEDKDGRSSTKTIYFRVG